MTFSRFHLFLSQHHRTHSRQWEFVVAQLAKNIVVAVVCGIIFFKQGKAEASAIFSNSSFNVSSLWYFAMLYTVLSCLQIIPILFFYNVSVPITPLVLRVEGLKFLLTGAHIRHTHRSCTSEREQPTLIRLLRTGLLTHLSVSHCYLSLTSSLWRLHIGSLVRTTGATLLSVSGGSLGTHACNYCLPTGLYADAATHFYAMFVALLNNIISFYVAQFMAAVSPSAEVS